MLTKFATFTGKHLCQSLVFNKVEKSLFFKNRPWHRYLPVNFAKFLRTSFLQNTSGRLLLNITLTRMLASRLIRSFIKKFHLNSFGLSQIFSAPDSHRDLTHFYGLVFSVISPQTAVRRIKVQVKITFLAKYDQSIWKLHAISCFG